MKFQHDGNREDDFETAGIVRQNRQRSRDNGGFKRSQRLGRRVRLPRDVRPKSTATTPLIQAREIVSESDIPLDRQAEVMAEVTQMKPPEIVDLIKTGKLALMLTAS